MSGVEDDLATEFYIEFQTVCQTMRDDTLPQDIARWALSAVERHTLIELRDWLLARHPLPRGEVNADFVNDYATERGIDLRAQPEGK
jgi:hypothetical protein